MIVSFSTTVDTAVTVMKMLVVIPLTLVLVLVPPTARCPLPLLSSPAFSVGAGAGCAVEEEEACVMGTTRRGASSEEEVVGDGEGDGGTGASEVMLVLVLVVWPGSWAAATRVLLGRSVVEAGVEVEVVSGIRDGVSAMLDCVLELLESEGVACSAAESVGASELVRDDDGLSSSELACGATVTYAVDEGSVKVTAPARLVVVAPGEEVSAVVGVSLLLLFVLLWLETPEEVVSPGWTVT